MRDIDEPKFKALLFALGAAFRHEVSGILAKVYWRALCDLDYSVIEQAGERHLKTSKFFPTVAELRLADTGAGTLLAAREFDQIVALAVHNAAVGMVFPRAEKVASVVSEAAAHAYTIAGGPRAFATALGNDDMTWVRKEYMAGYKEALQQGVPMLPATTQPALDQVGSLVKQIAAKRDYRNAAANDTEAA